MGGPKNTLLLKVNKGALLWHWQSGLVRFATILERRMHELFLVVIRPLLAV